MIRSTCRLRDRCQALCVRPPPTSKDSQILVILLLISYRSLSSWSWMISLQFDSVRWLCSQLIAVAEWEFGTVRSAQSRDASQRLYNQLLHKWVRLWKLPGGVLWMKEGEKTFTLIRYKCKRTECSLQMLPKKQALLYLAYEFIWVSECCYCGSVAWLFN